MKLFECTSVKRIHHIKMHDFNIQRHTQTHPLTHTAGKMQNVINADSKSERELNAECDR